MSDFEFTVTAILVILGFYVFMRSVIGLSKGGSILAMVVATLGSIAVFGSKDRDGGENK